MRRANACDSAKSLLELSRSPWEIEMNHDAGVLKVHSLTEKIGRQEQRHDVTHGGWSTPGCYRSKSGDCIGSRNSSAEDSR